MQQLSFPLGDDRPDAGAIFDDERRYRYVLWRTWDPAAPRCCWIMLNPSTATEYQLDATNRRCVRFSKEWGYGGMDVLNIHAWRSTDPKKLYQVDDPTGPDNDRWIVHVASRAAFVVVAWGIHGRYLDRDRAVMALLSAHGIGVYALGHTMDGFPKHPLYLPATAGPRPYVGRPSAINSVSTQDQL